MIANFEDKPVKLEFSRSLWERLLKIHKQRYVLNNSMIAVKLKVQNSRFKVQDSKLYFVQRSFIKVVKRAKKH